MRLIQIAAFGLVGAAYTTMVLGAYVKAIYAGMSCPEWPTCDDGLVLPPLDNAGVAAEMFHRIAATTVIIMGILLLALEWLQYRSEKRLILLTLATGGLLGLQVALGAITISSNLHAVVVTSHLAVATLFFACTILLAQRVWKLPPPKANADAPVNAAESESAETT